MKTQSIPTLKKFAAAAATALLLAACAGTGSGPVPDGHYRVQRGDTLYRIAKRYGQSVSTLAAWNNLRDTSQIEAGQVLRVRRNTSGSRSPSAAHATAERAVVPVNRLDMQWPVENGSSNVIQTYDGAGSKGIDIRGEQGQPIKAAAAGEVLYAGEAVRAYGKLILISHNTASITAYAHNDTILVQKGQTVTAGQQIATMGSSDTDIFKLHFEVRINGKAVNPVPYLTKP